jgi:hypothetical protein
MNPAALASALIASRAAQAQMAVAAKLMKQANTVDAAVIQQLLVAADQNGQRLAAAAQQGMGEYIDFMA